MKKTNWKDTAELIGIAAIVASLIFVGLQMKQAQEIALSASYQSRADSSLEIRAMPLESPELLSAMTKLRSPNRSDLTEVELTAVEWFLASNLVYLENTHYQYINGFLSEEQWQSNVGDLKLIFEIAENRRIWDRGHGSWRESFQNEIQKVLDSIDAGAQQSE